MSDRLLTVSEAAAHLQVARNTVYRMVRRQELPAVRVGSRCLRFRRPDLERYLDLRRTARVQLHRPGQTA